MNQVNQQTISAVRESSRGIVRALGLLTDACLGLDLSNSQCHALIEIAARQELSVKDLAQLLNLEKSSASRLVSGLLRKKLVHRLTAEKDARQSLVSLTNKGKDTVSVIHARADAQVSEALAQLPSHEVNQVVAGLRIYARGLAIVKGRSRFSIRKMRRSDNKQVATIIRKVMPEFGASGPGFALHDPEVSAMFEAYRGQNKAYYVVTDGEKILDCGGIAPLKGSEKGICELRKMYFLPELRGLGFGEKLLRQCLLDAKRMKYRDCYLETLHSMKAANKLYEKFGFKDLAKPKGCTGHFACDRWRTLDLDKFR